LLTEKTAIEGQVNLRNLAVGHLGLTLPNRGLFNTGQFGVIVQKKIPSGPPNIPADRVLESNPQLWVRKYSPTFPFGVPIAERCYPMCAEQKHSKQRHPELFQSAVMHVHFLIKIGL
jgi:hypothetical protein